MEQLFQWLATFSSIISLPFAVSFYLILTDIRYHKAKKELIEILSNYIELGNKLTHSYLSSVINAKLRENNINKKFISEEILIEDLIVKIMSNSTLTSDSKETILYNLVMLLPLNSYDDSESNDQEKLEKDNNKKSKFYTNILKELKKGNSIASKAALKQEIKLKNLVLIKKANIIVVYILTILSFLISSGHVTKILSVDLTNHISQILTGVISSLIATLIVFIIKKIYIRYK